MVRPGSIVVGGTKFPVHPELQEFASRHTITVGILGYLMERHYEQFPSSVLQLFAGGKLVVERPGIVPRKHPVEEPVSIAAEAKTEVTEHGSILETKKGTEDTKEDPNSGSGRRAGRRFGRRGRKKGSKKKGQGDD